MFMMPMPPTSKETAAMLASSHVIVVVVAVSTLAISSRLRTEKSSRLARCQTVPIAEQRGNLLRHHVERHAVGRRDHDALNVRDAE